MKSIGNVFWDWSVPIIIQSTYENTVQSVKHKFSLLCPVCQAGALEHTLKTGLLHKGQVIGQGCCYRFSAADVRKAIICYPFYCF